MVAREGKVAPPRAEREARAAAALRHPRCQRIYALARDPGHVYIAYEYVPGRTLRQALAAGELGDRDAVEVAAQVLEALAHAHGRGIVHRDVKPSNVLLAEGDADRRPAARLRPRPDGRVRHADRDRRRARARSPTSRPSGCSDEHRDRGGRRLGGRRDALGGARGPAPVPRRQRGRDVAPDPGRRAGARDRAARPAASAARRRRARAHAQSGAGGRARRASRRPADDRHAEAAPEPGRAEAPQAAARRGTGPRGDRAASACPPALAAHSGRAGSRRALPFYPAGLAARARGRRRRARPRVAPRGARRSRSRRRFFPLANISLGLALLFAAARRRVDGAHLARPARRTLAARRRAAARAARRPRAAAARGPARPRAGTPRRAGRPPRSCSRRSSPGCEHQPLPFDGADAAARARDRRQQTGPAPSRDALWRALDGAPGRCSQRRRARRRAAALPYLRGRGPWPAAPPARAPRRHRARRPARGVLPLARGRATAASAWRPVPLGSGRRARSGRRLDYARSGPTTKRCSRLRRRETVPTFSPTRVVDADLRADVALRVDVDPRRRSRARRGARSSSCGVVEALVVDRDEQPGRPERAEQLRERRRRLPLRVVGGSSARGSRPACWRPRSSSGASQRTSVSHTW